MLIIGVTGSYSSGKSFVTEYFKNLGYDVLSADKIVNNLYTKKEIRSQVVEILTPIKEFNKQKIAELVYNDGTWRKKLEDFIHPYIIKELEEFKVLSHDKAIIFAEIPLLFECNYKKYFDFTLTCFCQEETRYKRAKMKEGFKEDLYRKIEKIQFSQIEKMTKADYIINTDDEVESVKLQMKFLLNILRNGKRNNLRYGNYRS